MKNLDYLFILICSFLGRIIVLGASFSEALVFIACISYILLNKHLDQKEIAKYNIAVDERINNLEEVVNKTSDSISALKVGSSYTGMRK